MGLQVPEAPTATGVGPNGLTSPCSRFTLKSVRIGSTPVLKIALPSSPLPALPESHLRSGHHRNLQLGIGDLCAPCLAGMEVCFGYATLEAHLGCYRRTGMMGCLNPSMRPWWFLNRLCSLFADPSGYVGRRTHQPWEDEGHVTGVTYHSLRRGWSRWLELQVQ